MELDAYLARVDYHGPVAPDLPCLTAIHRHHLLNIPYEDLDVQLGRALDLDPPHPRRCGDGKPPGVASEHRRPAARGWSCVTEPFSATKLRTKSRWTV